LLTTENDIVEIVEGKTKILVPKGSLDEMVPPKEPAFFNPKAKHTRDLSIIAYSAFFKNAKGPKIFFDGLSGLGARGLRVANEINGVKKVVVNDTNPKALELASKSAKLNGLNNFEISEEECCRFLSSHSRKEQRSSIVDIDPFGSPSKYIDCGIRATIHGGVLSLTATDLQVLHGLFNDACKRRYGGIPIRTEYGDEIAIRLILGCVRTVAARFDIEIIPIFVENDMHYHRVYMRILNRADQGDNMGYILHCKSCGHRAIINEQESVCGLCNSKIELAGPLWIGQLFEKSFVESMLEESADNEKIKNILKKCVLESEIPEIFYTIDEIASKNKTSPPKLEKVIEKLQGSGFKASPTSFSPSGFRTDAKINEISSVFVS